MKGYTMLGTLFFNNKKKPENVCIATKVAQVQVDNENYLHNAPPPQNSNGHTIQDNDFDENYNEESDDDWADDGASADGNSSSYSSDAESGHYELFGEAGLQDHDGCGNGDEQVSFPWTSYTLEESEALQAEVKEIGLMKFLDKYLIQGQVSPLKMMEAFNVVMHPGAATALSEVHQFSILRQVINRHLRKRQRLENVNTLEDVVDLLAKAHNVMIVTGAGVSVSCGIPDFRSENGIYSRLQDYDLDDPQQMFDIKIFRENPEIFYSFAKELWPSNYEPSPSHLFVKMIEDKGKLLRNYTQNIDTLEHKANIKRVVNCHGSFSTASCVTCGYQCEAKEIEKYIFEQTVPPCPKCGVDNGASAAKSDDDEDGHSAKRGVSVMKPDITFFGESLPAEFDRLLELDTDVVDLLIVMGSSLKVSPVSEIMSQIPHSVPQILINRTPITHMTFDVQLLGDCDVIVPELCRMLGWDLRHKKLPGGSALNQEQTTGQGKIWQFRRNGLYTFPGAVVTDRYLALTSQPSTISSSSESSSSEADPSDDDSADDQDQTEQ
ncbi:DHS-like NAD/FAD-binding domain-containing protein [Dichotomocladium elegans]|nr:DHS-like NAD/FAD-binding domain-containing protein [Dichotomocladium elegans]